MRVITRFAPSPTGYLHIGGARTALFNYLFAAHHGGSFKLRIEDTDHARSTDKAIAAIHEGLNWLGLKGDGQPLMQSTRADVHRELAMDMLESGAAYKCFLSKDELDNLQKKSRKSGEIFRSPWRDSTKSPDSDSGTTVVKDMVQGRVQVKNSQLDDLILLRSDGNPTYMLAVVADDHDMGITHIIRGDDHLGNAFRQYHIYQALGWTVPEFAHIPLIHGADGTKLSKRHGATGLDSYREMGILPEAMLNYLARLGWSHGDDELFSLDEAIKWFDGRHIGKAIG